MRAWISIVLMAVVVILPACSSTGKEKLEEEKPVEVLYREAAAALDKGDTLEATRLFEEVERQHPYSQWATRAQLMAAFASYEGRRYDEAVFALDRFIQLHPGHKDIPYAFYLKALSYYEQISDVRRDQKMTRQAMEALEALIRRFPESEYTRDAVLKRDLTLDHLAGKEMEIGRYYLNRGFINAAINRFRAVIKDYQTTTHTAEALHRLVESYMILGLRQEATRVAAVLGHNYPGSPWYERSYTLLDDSQRAALLDGRGFFNKTVDSIFKPD